MCYPDAPTGLVTPGVTPSGHPYSLWGVIYIVVSIIAQLLLQHALHRTSYSYWCLVGFCVSISTSVSVRCPYVCCVPGIVQPQPFRGVDYYFSFLCSVFLIMAPATATTTTLHLIVVCSRASPLTLTVTMDPTCLCLAALGQYEVVLPLQLIPSDTIRGSVGLATVLQQQFPLSHITCQACATYAMGSPQVSFLFQS